MKRILIVGMIVWSGAAFAQSPSTADYNAALAEAGAQRDWALQRSMQAAVQIAQMQKRIAELEAEKAKPNASDSK